MNITGKYLKVWKVKNQNGYTKLDLGDSKKLKDGSYHNWTWFDCTLLGKAKDVELNEGDTIDVVSGIISQREYNGKWYNDIIIFEVNVLKRDKPIPEDYPQDTKEPDVIDDKGDDSFPF